MEASYKRYIYKELDTLISQAYDLNKEINYIMLDSEELELLEDEVDEIYSTLGGCTYVDNETNKEYKGLKSAIIDGHWPFKYKGIRIHYSKN